MKKNGPRYVIRNTQDAQYYVVDTQEGPTEGDIVRGPHLSLDVMREHANKLNRQDAQRKARGE